MDYQLRFHDRAINDIRVYCDQIAEYSRESAEKWRRGLLAEIDNLRRFPLRCPLAPEGEKHGDRNVRHMVYGKRRSAYRVLFMVQDDVVTIMAVWRATRGPAQL